jgi:hypothetical protein
MISKYILTVLSKYKIITSMDSYILIRIKLQLMCSLMLYAYYKQTPRDSLTGRDMQYVTYKRCVAGSIYF